MGVVSAALMADIRIQLERMGVYTKESWVFAAIEFLKKENQPVTFDSVYQQFLYTDIRVSGASGITERVTDQHKFTIKGPHVLQVNEIFNIGDTYENRVQESANRVLKLSLSDGEQTFFGFEYHRLPNVIHVNSKPGLKVCLFHFYGRNGPSVSLTW